MKSTSSNQDRQDEREENFLAAGGISVIGSGRRALDPK